MAVYSVDSDAVLAATANMRSAIDRVQAENQAMLTHLVQLQSSWTGAASTAFQSLIDQWRAAQRHVDDVVLGINGALGVAGRQYAEAEQASVGLFR